MTKLERLKILAAQTDVTVFDKDGARKLTPNELRCAENFCPCQDGDRCNYDDVDTKCSST